LRYCLICSSGYEREVKALSEQGKNYRQIREWLKEHDVAVWENSVRYHLLHHPLKKTEKERYLGHVAKYGKQRVDEFWLREYGRLPT
jgi:hypothetical protein